MAIEAYGDEDEDENFDDEDFAAMLGSDDAEMADGDAEMADGDMIMRMMKRD